MHNLKISCKSKIKLLQLNIPSDVSDKHYSSETKGWPLRIIRSQILEYFIILFYFMVFFW